MNGRLKYGDRIERPSLIALKIRFVPDRVAGPYAGYYYRADRIWGRRDALFDGAAYPHWRANLSLERHFSDQGAIDWLI